MIIGIDCSRAFGTDKTGTENYSYYIINHILRLPESKKHHFVLYTRPGALIADWIDHSIAEVVTVPYRYLWTQAGLAAATWRRKLDVLWIPAHTLPVLRKPGVKTVVTIHGLEYRWLPEYSNLLQRWYLPLSTYYAARYADRLIAVSAFTKRQLIEEIGISPEKIEVIHEGIPGLAHKKRDDNAAVMRRYDLEEREYILYVGTVQPRKNLPALIRAYSLARSEFPALKLVIAGSRGWMTREIFTAAERNGVPDGVIFTGRVTDAGLDALYTRAALYVQPSFQEGFGLPVLEAMTRGVPVLVSDGGALPEVAGGAGIVTPLGDNFADKLAENIVSLLRDSTLRRRLAAAGIARAAAFSWQNAAHRTLSLLTQ